MKIHYIYKLPVDRKKEVVDTFFLPVDHVYVFDIVRISSRSSSSKSLIYQKVWPYFGNWLLCCGGLRARSLQLLLSQVAEYGIRAVDHFIPVV